MNPLPSRVGLFGVVACLAFSRPSGGAEGEVTAVLTADNHYGLYHAAADGGELTFIGRNEMGSAGDPGDYNWILPETWTFEVPDGHHLYVVAWDEDCGALSAWIGEFVYPDGAYVPSDLSSWECVCGSGACAFQGDVPADDVILSDIEAGGFSPPGWSAPNGSDPWGGYAGGLISGIGPDASFIWIYDPNGGLTSCVEHYVVFRTVEPVTVGQAPPRFGRGDVDGSGTLEITDPIGLLNFLFLGGPSPTCEDSADSDDNGALELTDAVAVLMALFLGGDMPPPPEPGLCGFDATIDALGCDSFGACP